MPRNPRPVFVLRKSSLVGRSYDTVPWIANLVLAGLLELRDRCIEAGAGSWQTAGLLKVYELLGRHLKMFTEKIEVGFDEELIKRLEAGRKRTALPVAAKTESK